MFNEEMNAFLLYYRTIETLADFASFLHWTEPPWEISTEFRELKDAFKKFERKINEERG
jgi:hypothetical protein